MLSVEDILQPENVSYTDNVWTWAVAHMLHKGEDWQITTITDTAPIEIVFLSKGEPLTDYLISGNTLQDSTPTPEATVDVQGCGEKTENLFDGTIESGSISAATGGNIGATNRCRSTFGGLLLPAGQYTTVASSSAVTMSSGTMYAYTTDDVAGYDPEQSITEWNSLPLTFALQSPRYVRFLFKAVGDVTIDPSTVSIMLNTGSTPLPYEPYGYKLPPTVNGTEYPIYLGQVPTTRRIKKLVLTGEEDGWRRTGTGCMGIIPDNRALRVTMPMCTHYTGSLAVSYVDLNDGECTVSTATNEIGFNDRSRTTIDSWKQWLSAQYAAGTPVTVWYVLAEPETGIVNEPLMKIGDYADTISFEQVGVTIPTVAGANTLTIDTTVQPSSVTIRGRIRPTL